MYSVHEDYHTYTCYYSHLIPVGSRFQYLLTMELLDISNLSGIPEVKTSQSDK